MIKAQSKYTAALKELEENFSKKEGYVFEQRNIITKEIKELIGSEEKPKWIRILLNIGKLIALIVQLIRLTK